MRYLAKRGRLLWKFIKMAPHAREIELALQLVEQDLHDTSLSNQIQGNKIELILEYKKGFHDGVIWCLKQSSSL